MRDPSSTALRPWAPHPVSVSAEPLCSPDITPLHHQAGGTGRGVVMRENGSLLSAPSLRVRTWLGLCFPTSWETAVFYVAKRHSDRHVSAQKGLNEHLLNELTLPGVCGLLSPGQHLLVPRSFEVCCPRLPAGVRVDRVPCSEVQTGTCPS